MSKMNYNLVRQYASDIYRYGRNNDDRITNAIVKFAHEGKKSPTIAELIKKTNSINHISNIKMNYLKI